jgi:hypothetical protein
MDRICRFSDREKICVECQLDYKHDLWTDQCEVPAWVISDRQIAIADHESSVARLEALEKRVSELIKTVVQGRVASNKRAEALEYKLDGYIGVGKLWLQR